MCNVTVRRQFQWQGLTKFSSRAADADCLHDAALPLNAVSATLRGSNLWFAERVVNKIGRMTPIGRVTEFPIPTPPADLARTLEARRRPTSPLVLVARRG
jgi:hypothetical protein